MSIQKLKNRVKGLETEMMGFGGRIPKDEQLLIVKTRSSETKEEVQKKFEILKDSLRKKYGDFSDDDLLCVRLIKCFDTEDLEMISENY